MSGGKRLRVQLLRVQEKQKVLKGINAMTFKKKAGSLSGPASEVISLCNLLLRLFNLEIIDLRSGCSLTGAIQHIKIELIRADCKTRNRQLCIGELLTCLISAHRNPCPRRIANLAVPRTVRTKTAAVCVIIAERPQHIFILVQHCGPR